MINLSGIQTDYRIEIILWCNTHDVSYDLTRSGILIYGEMDVKINRDEVIIRYSGSFDDDNLHLDMNLINSVYVD